MRREGKPVGMRVAPGPDNPLGRHWIGLSIDSLGIHGTNAPASVFGLRSHGCLRVHPDDVARLFERVAVGTPGVIVYRPALLAADAQGRVWAEVHPDAYRRAPPPMEVLGVAAARAGLSERIDWGKVADVVRGREGLAREVGIDRAEPPPGTVPKSP